MQSEIQLKITRGHTDELGHLNHVQALDFLQSGRLDLYGRVGLGLAGQGGRYGTVVVNLNVNFRKECFAGESVTVQTVPLRLGTKSFVVAQRILRPDGQVAMDGAVTSVVMDMESRRLVPVPEVLAVIFPQEATVPPGGCHRSCRNNTDGC